MVIDAAGRISVGIVTRIVYFYSFGSWVIVQNKLAHFVLCRNRSLEAAQLKTVSTALVWLFER